MPGDQIQFDPNLGSTDRQIRGPTGPSPSKNFKVFFGLVRAGPRLLKFFQSLSGSRFLNFAGPCPGPTGFDPWIPDRHNGASSLVMSSVSLNLVTNDFHWRPI